MLSQPVLDSFLRPEYLLCVLPAWYFSQLGCEPTCVGMVITLLPQDLKAGKGDGSAGNRRAQECEDLSLILITHVKSSAWWHTLVIPALGKQKHTEPLDMWASQFIPDFRFSGRRPVSTTDG